MRLLVPLFSFADEFDGQKSSGADNNCAGGYRGQQAWRAFFAPLDYGLVTFAIATDNRLPVNFFSTEWTNSHTHVDYNIPPAFTLSRVGFLK